MQNNQSPQATWSLASWLCYLEHLHTKPIELGLERVRQVAQRLDLLHPAPIVFTVAGTNGKGTTCRVLEMILLSAGYRVGVYSSPHLMRYTERVRIQGEMLKESVHCDSFSKIETSRNATSLTYFEFSTLSALQLFKQAQLDVVILEVGLGGRLDATNIIDSDVAIITSIALDHTDWLGNSRESIGREKAGVFRAKKPAIVGEPDMPYTIAEVADSIDAKLIQCGIQWSYKQTDAVWHWQEGDVVLNNLPLPAVPLANAATALAALYHSPLSIDNQAIIHGLQRARLPGRFQVIQKQPLVILDVAHNPHSAEYLAAQLKKLPTEGGVLRMVIGMLSDKDIAGTLFALTPLVDVWYCASLEGVRAAPAQQLAQYLPNAHCFNSVDLAWQKAIRDAQSHDCIVVCGSFYTVAAVMQALKMEGQDGE